MTNERFAASSNKRARYSGAIANVNLHVLQRCAAIMNEDEIRRVENTTRAQRLRDIRPPGKEWNVRLGTLRM